MNIELTIAQFLGLCALGLAGGFLVGVGVGIGLYARCGRTF